VSASVNERQADTISGTYAQLKYVMVLSQLAEECNLSCGTWNCMSELSFWVYIKN